MVFYTTSFSHSIQFITLKLRGQDNSGYFRYLAVPYFIQHRKRFVSLFNSSGSLLLPLNCFAKWWNSVDLFIEVRLCTGTLLFILYLCAYFAITIKLLKQKCLRHGGLRTTLKQCPVDSKPICLASLCSIRHTRNTVWKLYKYLYTPPMSHLDWGGPEPLGVFACN